MIYYADETLAPEEILDSFDPLKDSLTYKIGDFYEVQKKSPDNKNYFKTPRGTIIFKEWLAFLCQLCSTEVIIDRAIFQFFKKKHGNLHPASVMCQICHCRLKHSIENFDYKKWHIYLKDKNLKPVDENWAFSNSSSSPLQEDLKTIIYHVQEPSSKSIKVDDEIKEIKVIPITAAVKEEIEIKNAVMENPLEIALAEDETRLKLEAFWDNLAKESSSPSKDPNSNGNEKSDENNVLCQMCKQKIPPHKKAGSKFCSLGCKNKFARYQQKADILKDL